MVKSIVWGMASFNYELVKDIKGCEDYELLVPGPNVYSSREAAADAAAAEINENHADYEDDETDGELDLDNPNNKPLTGESLEWHDVHSPWSGQKRWRTKEQDDMNVYVIFELELVD